VNRGGVFCSLFLWRVGVEVGEGGVGEGGEVGVGESSPRSFPSSIE